MTNKKYKLQGKKIVETDLIGWAKFLENPKRNN